MTFHITHHPQMMTYCSVRMSLCFVGGSKSHQAFHGLGDNSLTSQIPVYVSAIVASVSPVLFC